ncbi:39S ribosomal protein L49, mitochondrial-like [Gigantopelta aegis]|uniref:39S ribosomal protein L49, mitochondrial-like n=1 Tax=Gigantopelta aegis TaxID=1735272 RepID=UPI001B88C588|nr:39S ribosomal protein L49, mitochondrial-like [Gigantopelta aegis]
MVTSISESSMESLSTFCRSRRLLSAARNAFRTYSMTRVAVTHANFHNETSNDLKITDDHPEVEVSHKEFKYVEKLLPKLTVPDPPQHGSYPTPSGWVAPTASSTTHPYFIKRTKNHMFPVYLETSHAGTRQLVKIKQVEGDIWAFEADLRSHLEQVTGKSVFTRVHEVSRYVQVKGLHLEEVSKLLLQKGF